MTDDRSGDAYSMPQIAPLYPQGPYEYHDTSALVIHYPIDQVLAEEVVPDPLEIGDEPTCSQWFFEYPRVSGIGSYNEFVVGIAATQEGDSLTYLVDEGLDSEVPVSAGRGIHGTGKKFGQVDLETHGNVKTGRYRRTGVNVVEATVECRSFVDRHPMTHDEARMAYWKRIPSAENGAPPAIDQITVSLT
jgi:acetoacetate decarboxylase